MDLPKRGYKIIEAIKNPKVRVARTSDNRGIPSWSRVSNVNPAKRSPLPTPAVRATERNGNLFKHDFGNCYIKYLILSLRTLFVDENKKQNISHNTTIEKTKKKYFSSVEVMTENTNK